MGDRFFKGVITGALFAFAAVGLFTGLNKFFFGNPQIIDGDFEKKVKVIERCIDANYLDSEDIDNEKVQDGMLKGYLSSINDKYAAYYNGEEYEAFKTDNAGQYVGIGAYVLANEETGQIMIVKPFDGSPAQKAGIEAGDIILEVGGTEVAGMELDTVVSMMKGPEGSSVDIKVLRGEKELLVTVERAAVDVPTVTHRILEDNIGYIAISTFDIITITQFREALDDIESKGAKGLIVDIRDNGGGDLDVVIDILDRLLPKGLLMYTERKDGKGEEYNSTDEEKYEKPMAVLINERSASASEVFAGAIQDYNAGTLIGTKSFGKGIVQGLFPLAGLNDGSAVKLTIARYYTPKGRNIHGTGIDPDIVIRYDEDSLEKRDDFYYDNQLEKAIEVLKQKIN